MQIDSKKLFDIQQNLTRKLIKNNPGTVIFITHGLTDKAIKIIWLGIEKSKTKASIAAFKKAINENNDDFINHVAWQENNRLEIYISDTAIIQRIAGVVSDSDAQATASNANDLQNINQKPIDKLLAIAPKQVPNKLQPSLSNRHNVLFKSAKEELEYIINKTVIHAPSAAALKETLNSLSDNNAASLAANCREQDESILKLCLAIQIIMVKMVSNQQRVCYGYLDTLWIYHKTDDKHVVKNFLLIRIPIDLVDFYYLCAHAFLGEILGLNFIPIPLPSRLGYQCEFKLPLSSHTTEKIDSILLKGMEGTMEYFMGYTDSMTIYNYFKETDDTKKIETLPKYSLDGQMYPAVLGIVNDRFYVFYFNCENKQMVLTEVQSYELAETISKFNSYQAEDVNNNNFGNN